MRGVSTKMIRKIISNLKVHHCSLGALLFLAAFDASQILVHAENAKERPPQQSYRQPSYFRYAIIYNDPGMDGMSRDLEILMEPSSFSEKNLRIMSDLLNRRFKDVSTYNAYIETSLEDIETPEERDPPAISERAGNPNSGKTSAATIRHSPKADMLYIYVPNRESHPVEIDLRIHSNK
jgi:hypothetical protein